MAQQETKLYQRDYNRIQRYTKDLESFSKEISKLIETLKEKKLLVSLTDQILIDLCNYNTGSLKEDLKQDFQKEAAFISNAFARQKFLDNLLDAYIDIDQLVSKFAERMETEKLALSLTLAPSDRAEYLTIKNGEVSFDSQKVIENNTIYLTGEYAEDFIKRAEQLFKQMVDFDREVRLLSKGSLFGIASEAGFALGADGLISVNGLSKIFLDWRLLSQLDFSHAKQLLSSDRTFDNSEICGSLQD